MFPSHKNEFLLPSRFRSMRHYSVLNQREDTDALLDDEDEPPLDLRSDGRNEHFSRDDSMLDLGTGKWNPQFYFLFTLYSTIWHDCMVITLYLPQFQLFTLNWSELNSKQGENEINELDPYSLLHGWRVHFSVFSLTLSELFMFFATSFAVHDFAATWRGLFIACSAASLLTTILFTMSSTFRNGL